MTIMFDKVRDDGGARQAYGTGAVREATTGKGRFDLVPPYPHLRLAKHYENGAKKYTTSCSVLKRDVTQWLTTIAPIVGSGLLLENGSKEDASGVIIASTHGPCFKETQDSVNGSNGTPKLGETGILSGSNKPRSNGATIPDVVNATLKQNVGTHYGKSAWMNADGMNCSLDSRATALFATDPSLRWARYILIMITGPVGFEEYCVVAATTVSASLTIALRCLKEQYGIFKNLPQVRETPEGVEITVSGDRNWEKGLPLSRFMDSAERHVNQFKAGDRTEDHLAAVLWNIYGVIWTEREIALGRLPKELYNVPWPPSLEHARE